MDSMNYYAAIQNNNYEDYTKSNYYFIRVEL